MFSRDAPAQAATDNSAIPARDEQVAYSVLDTVVGIGSDFLDPVFLLVAGSLVLQSQPVQNFPLRAEALTEQPAPAE